MNKKGEPRHGGREKGTPNKRTQDVLERLRSLGCDPIEGMARIAMGLVECPECRGAKRQKYSAGIAGPYVDVDGGKEKTCCKCVGTGKEPIPTKLAGDMFAELAQYIAPKRKAIEVSGEGGEPLRLEIVLNEAKPAGAK